MTPIWVTWTSPYTKEVTVVAHQLRGKFNDSIPLHTRCGKKFAGQSAAVADANAPKCRTCTKRAL
jgi:hypothetical protein